MFTSDSASFLEGEILVGVRLWLVFFIAVVEGDIY